MSMSYFSTDLTSLSNPFYFENMLLQASFELKDKFVVAKTLQV